MCDFVGGTMSDAKLNVVFNGEQEKESIICVRMAAP